MKTSTTRLPLLFFPLLFLAFHACADLTLKVDNVFIEKYKNRVTIDANFTIDKAHKKPNTPAKDGDMHIAGRSPEIRLATVAEIMNAVRVPDALDVVKNSEGTGSSIPISGAWRLWPEHGGTDEVHKQGQKLDPFTTTNPDHLFEIHPISNIGGVDVTSTFTELAGYKPKDASDAFFHYESKRFEIKAVGKQTAMVFPGVGYNYVKFMIEFLEKPVATSNGDGTMAFVKVRDEGGHLILRKLRMAFVKDTPPEIAARDMGPDKCMIVLGMPRISLTLVSWRMEQVRKGIRGVDILKWGLPYEMIVVGKYDEACELD